MQTTRLEMESRRAPELAALRARARRVETCPPPFSSSRADGTRARGLTYERKVGKYLAGLCAREGWKLWDHQWFIYRNKDDTCYFQPDFIVERPSEPLLIEVKLTYVDTSYQLKKYLEYLRLFGLDCIPLTIVRNLTPGTSPITEFSQIKPNAVLHLWV